MLYDRPYMRHSFTGAEPKIPPIVMNLIFITVGVFVLQQVMDVFFPAMGGGSNSFMSEWFALSGRSFRELKVWTIVSYSFLHSTAGFFHIFGNMIGLFFIGRIIEPLIGKERFLGLYLGGSLVGGLIYLFFHFGGSSPVVGASASVMAILTLFCLLYPERPITLLLFFILPITVKPKWVFWGSLVVSTAGVLLYELPGQSYVAHSAHLGGMLTGIFYFRYIHNRPNPFFRSNGSYASIEQPAWYKRLKNKDSETNYKVNRTDRDNLQQEVDQILDKINSTGFGSLTEYEKHTLDRAKDILGR